MPVQSKSPRLVESDALKASVVHRDPTDRPTGVEMPREPRLTTLTPVFPDIKLAAWGEGESSQGVPRRRLIPCCDMGLEETFEALLARRRDAGRLRRLDFNPPGLVDFSSNDYLSLAENADIQTNVLARLERRVSVAKRHQTVTQAQEHRRILGSGGSRLLDGNSPLAEGLEKKVAAFHGAPAALLFNSAYDANVGLLSCAPQPGDVVLFDEAIHASVHDGMRLSRASQCIPFSHSSIARGVENGAAADSAAPSIDDVLKEITAAGYPNMGVRDGSSNVFICVEAVYSMDGSVLRARDLVKTVKNHLPHGSGHIIIDEAHSTGVLGSRGRGLVCDSGLEKAIWARVHGFGKAMGCAGGKDHFIKPKPRLSGSADG